MQGVHQITPLDNWFSCTWKLALLLGKSGCHQACLLMQQLPISTHAGHS